MAAPLPTPAGSDDLLGLLLVRVAERLADIIAERLAAQLPAAPSAPAPREPEPLTLSLVEVGDRLSVARSTAFHLVTSGQLPCVRIGRTIRVSRAALEKFVRSREGIYSGLPVEPARPNQRPVRRRPDH